MGWAPVELGEHEYEVVPQRIAYLDAKLGSISELLDLDLGAGGESLVKALGENAHRLLKVFIPDLMPEWEWRGFASPTAAERGEYDEEGDRSPTFTQIVAAFETVMGVNKLDLFKHLGKLVGTDFLKVAMQKTIADSMLRGSPSSAPPNTASTPTPSGIPDPTSADDELPVLTEPALS